MANIARVNSELSRQIALILSGGELSDPRLDGLVSVTRVDCTNDLKYAKVFVSYLGPSDKKAGVMSALTGSAGYIRELLKKRVEIRTLPEFKIVFDDSIEYALKLSSLIDKANRS